MQQLQEKQGYGLSFRVPSFHLEMSLPLFLGQHPLQHAPTSTASLLAYQIWLFALGLTTAALQQPKPPSLHALGCGEKRGL